ncbi:Cobyrinate a,c-diamide synthase [Anoxybacillus sp. P3H1B]|jgi:cobyrinic acid a,c-diamide synthase|uniref:cobyrinate a,c-diamide synthase n=1 Tax=Anoxybacillaceae TaxID=3120669 RepID=UPI0007988788|nr:MULTISPECIES: cobyrinate a,c-diamide synthase [Anoxybacillus]KXG09232.1 Cobyrinate a,c-diamide synthase [Anoxybacillus sp. P3H1B]MBS2772388.1 cobyrinate a,c-diamide synthase [Anoxybacillus rupiensis]
MRRMVIAGTGSGVGKTTITIGVMAALKKKGYTVQGFKCGPDYIDPTYHAAVTGRPSRNLDSWMGGEDIVKAVCQKGGEGADIAVIEGVMGFFDGKQATSIEGSTAEISLLTKSPVLLVVDCSGMARSAAAVVRGFQLLDERVHIAGVIANRVGSEGHFRLVKAAIEQECGIPVIGYLQKQDDLHIPERHLGLVPSIERGELDHFFAKLGERIAQTIDLDRLLQLAQAPELEVKPSFLSSDAVSSVRIAVAKDAAFHFYYPENLEMLEAYGAKLMFFSPLAGETVPDDSDGLYIGGGFPEEFAEQLSKQEHVKQSIKQAIERGIPTLAECGGFMFLTEGIETTDRTFYEMVGVIPGRVRMQEKLAALGYREVTGDHFLLPKGTAARGHEFHYSTFTRLAESDFAYEAKGLRGVKKDGYMRGNLVAGYIHLYFPSCPDMVKRWLQQCERMKHHA